MKTEEQALTERNAIRLQQAATMLGTWEGIRGLLEQSSFILLMDELRKLQEDAKAISKDALDRALETNTPEALLAYNRARIDLLAYDKAIGIFIDIREAAKEARKILDTQAQNGV